MIEFILNNKTVRTDQPTGSLLLDLIRYQQKLKGTKIGCREGDCGACTVLAGQLVAGKMQYEHLTSCLTPIANIHGKHVVTVEGLSMENLSPIQQAMVDESGTQCGFCTPGFVMSLTNYSLLNQKPDQVGAIAAIDGNICRCTGYKSIERAALSIVDQLADRNIEQPTAWLVANKFIPEYFLSIADRIEKLSTRDQSAIDDLIVGGGTDLYVQRPDDLVTQNIRPTSQQEGLRSVITENGRCIIGAGSTVSDLEKSGVLQAMIPNLKAHIKLVSSTPIRNISTIAGNFVNASPIGDLTAFFLALNSTIKLQKAGAERTIALKDFYLGYKDLDKAEGEIITEVSFDSLDSRTHFNLEKVSKRVHLDIASVNSGIQIKVDSGKITTIHLAAGGVGPTPKYLSETVAFMKDKALTPLLVKEANDVMQNEVSPMSDVRGTEEYKRLLLRQLFFAHFLKLFPSEFILTDLT